MSCTCYLVFKEKKAVYSFPIFVWMAMIQIVDRAPTIELSDLPFNLITAVTGTSFYFSKKRHSFIPRGKKKDRRSS